MMDSSAYLGGAKISSTLVPRTITFNTTGVMLTPLLGGGAGSVMLNLVQADNVHARLQIIAPGTGVPGFDMGRCKGTLGSPTAVGAGDSLFVMGAYGYFVTGGPGWSGATGGIRCQAQETFTSTAQGTITKILGCTNGTTTLNEELLCGGGVQVGAPTGGAKGLGTLNIQGTIWTNGTQGVATFGPSAVTSITVKNGIVTAIS